MESSRNNNLFKEENPPIDHFREINMDKIVSWEKVLFESKLPIRQFVNDDSELFNVEENLPNQRVVRNDCDRTRSRERKVQQSFVDYAEKLLTYYCIENNVKYKQGLNEIVGPFVLIKTKVDISFSRLYNLFICFIDKFLTNYFIDDEFYSLQSSLSLLSLLLKYHDPEIYNLFEYSAITPELYAMSWMLTLFANKIRLDIIYHLWDKVILFNDNMFMHFLSVAFLIKSKDKYIKADYSQVPSIISQLVIKTTDEMDSIIDLALDIYEKTPISLRKFADKLEIFKFKSERFKEMYENYAISSLPAFPMLPSEVINLVAQSDGIECIDSECPCYKPKIQKIRNPSCSYCQNENNKIKENFIIIDLRIKDITTLTPVNQILNHQESNTSCGFLKCSHFPKNSKYLDIKNNSDIEIFFNENIVNKVKDKDIHIIFLTSETDFFKEKGTKRLKQKITESDILRYKRGSNDKNIHISKYKYPNKEIAIYEYYLMTKLIKLCYRNKFKYVSFVYGGFIDIHDIANQFKIQLSSHGVECELCKRRQSNENILGMIDTVKNFFETNFNKKKSSKEIEYWDDLNESSLEEMIKNNHEYVYKGIMNEEGKSTSSSCFVILSDKGINVYKAKKGNCALFYHLIMIKFEDLRNVSNDKKFGNFIMFYFRFEGIDQFLMINFRNEKKVHGFIKKTRELIKENKNQKENKN